MKVNVIGRGFISGVGLLPVRDIELDESGIRRLLNFNNVRVFESASGAQITAAFFNKKAAVKKPAPVVEKPAPKIDTPVIPEPVVKKEDVPVEVVPEIPKFEAQVTPYITEPVEETPAVEEPVVEEAAPVVEDVVDDAPTEEETVEEAVEESVTEEEAPSEEEKKEYKPYYNKKNKKNRK